MSGAERQARNFSAHATVKELGEEKDKQ